jgi:tRNA threonylcarbamoyladenosine biosynthesis protein TsaB
MLLAIDTATNHASIALHDEQRLRGECTWEAINRHTVTLLPHIREMLAETGITPENLSAIAVCRGPGSYTGVRIGLAAAKGIAITRHLPLVGLTTLDILVAAQPPRLEPLYAVFAAGRRRVGFARYQYGANQWQAETGVEVVPWTEIVDHIQTPASIVGEIPPNGLSALKPLGEDIHVPSPAHRLRRAGFLAELAWERLRAGYHGDPARLDPLYAR